MVGQFLQGVQVYIEVQDDDEGNDDLIDLLLIDHNLTVAESQQQNHIGIFEFVIMNLTITVFCIPGEPCQTNIDDCVGVDCSANGRCVDGVNTFTCDCVQGFTGEFCQTNVDDCVGVDCSGNGRCVDGVNTFACDCVQGFTGELCQTNIDDCVGVDCSRNGRCVDGVNTFTCNCDSGFIGDLCETNIDDCVGVDCSGNGRCMDGVNSFTCECTAGFSGPQCSEGKHRSCNNLYINCLLTFTPNIISA